MTRNLKAFRLKMHICEDMAVLTTWMCFTDDFGKLQLQLLASSLCTVLYMPLGHAGTLT